MDKRKKKESVDFFRFRKAYYFRKYTERLKPENRIMMYPFMTLNDNTEIVHSEMKNDGTVLVHIEKPDAEVCFKSADCILPSYKWENICAFSEEDIQNLEKIIRSVAHLILEFSQTGGFDNASGL